MKNKISICVYTHIRSNIYIYIQLLQNDLRPRSFLHILNAWSIKAILYSTKTFFRLQ